MSIVHVTSEHKDRDRMNDNEPPRDRNGPARDAMPFLVAFLVAIVALLVMGYWAL